MQTIDNMPLPMEIRGQMEYSIDELHNGEVDHEVVKQSLLNWVENNLKQPVNNT